MNEARGRLLGHSETEGIYIYISCHKEGNLMPSEGRALYLGSHEPVRSPNLVQSIRT